MCAGSLGARRQTCCLMHVFPSSFTKPHQALELSIIVTLHLQCDHPASPLAWLEMCAPKHLKLLWPCRVWSSVGWQHSSRCKRATRPECRQDWFTRASPVQFLPLKLAIIMAAAPAWGGAPVLKAGLIHATKAASVVAVTFKCSHDALTSPTGALCLHISHALQAQPCMIRG